MGFNLAFNFLNAELNFTFHLLALLGAYHILHVSRIRVKGLSYTVRYTSVSAAYRRAIPLGPQYSIRKYSYNETNEMH
jgi:hypothetical protein